MKQFNTITLLITHYNRSQSLERLLKTFNDQQIAFGDIVVSDDGSKPEHQDYLKQIQNIYNFRLITTPKNKGLGNNINKGQDAVTTPYTLYVQEDFDPFPGYSEHLEDALSIMDERPDVDIARFYAYFKYPYLKPYRNGFSEMIFNVLYPGYRKFHCYSDHPHLRRSTFFNKFGRYAEGIKGDRTEFLMAISFLKNKGKAMFYEDYKGLFDQINSSDEPSTMKRSDLRQSSNFVISFVRAIYRNLKHNYDYMSAKKIDNKD
ncbi:Glycosyltransferase involved in cell wall bisynthesis [Mucilaginibacter mallensis]|uniref:Glycosyltransferase involved in cell wall bisynthesis n=1 Tax=Mucilaginibacter mallensis TaxID=652787 RepID=A0A1H1VV24_MUCMA|nr:glycosyltransferase family 2 protein [Mucilaginibacter mallensis]SDS88545.1 Glycosyltransferase involved in cell wall bisynthesis [Mucilaginibacter mallensis]